jgi:thiamine biosynthesis lipoprotein
MKSEKISKMGVDRFRILGISQDIWAIAAALSISLSVEGARFETHLEQVMGTSLELQVEGPNLLGIEQAEKICLEAIDSWSDRLSTYQSNSEISQWMRLPNQAIELSPECMAFLVTYQDWMEQSEGRLHPGISRLTELWQEAESLQQLPASESLTQVRNTLKASPWTLDAIQRRATRLGGNEPLNFDAIAKGYIIEQAAHAILDQVPQVHGVLLNIGGDMVALGSMQARVDIANPRSASDNDLIETITLQGGQSLASSGGYHRGYTIKGIRYAHIIDPLTGYPVSHLTCANVVAPRARDADALATLFCILHPSEALAWADQHDGVECLIVDEKGHKHISRGWDLMRQAPSLTFTSTDSQPSPLHLTNQDAHWTEGMEFSVSFEVIGERGRRYRRPYLAVWITDAEGEPVRTLALWIQKEKWLRDLRSWYRLARSGDARINTRTLASATKPPGTYRLQWDGKDAKGQLVPSGDYHVHIEAVREHGGYQVLKEAFKLDGKPFQINLNGSKEVRSATVTLSPKSARTL